MKIETALCCKRCGKLLRIATAFNTRIGICVCGFVKTIDSATVSEKQHHETRGTGILREEKLPGFPHNCKKCKYTECEVEDLGAQYSDESNVYLYKCKRCGHVERQADGTGNN